MGDKADQQIKISEIVKAYKSDGLAIIPEAILKSEVDKINLHLDESDPNVTIPLTKLPWGYGNRLRDSDFGALTENKIFHSVLKNIFDEGFEFNHLVVNEKPAYFGTPVEWHQECANLATYAPGSKADRDWNKFCQVFIALDDQDHENGGVFLWPMSHQLGMLKHYDMISPMLTHKRQIDPTEFKKLEKYGVPICPKLDKGDAVVFNHLIAHGSGSNISARRRRSVVLQAQAISINSYDEHQFKKEAEYRREFIISSLENRIHTLKGGNIYGELAKK